MTVERKLLSETPHCCNKQVIKIILHHIIFDKHSFTCNTVSEWVFLKKKVVAFSPSTVQSLCFFLYTYNAEKPLLIHYILWGRLALACSSQTPDSLSGSQRITVLSIEADNILIGCCMLPPTVQGKRLPYTMRMLSKRICSYWNANKLRN